MLERKKVKPTKEELRELEVKKQIKERKEKENREVLQMKFHDTIYISSIKRSILRVQSGWIYDDYDDVSGTVISSTFVIDTRE